MTIISSSTVLCVELAADTVVLIIEHMCLARSINPGRKYVTLIQKKCVLNNPSLLNICDIVTAIVLTTTRSVVWIELIPWIAATFIRKCPIENRTSASFRTVICHTILALGGTCIHSMLYETKVLMIIMRQLCKLQLCSQHLLCIV